MSIVNSTTEAICVPICDFIKKEERTKSTTESSENGESEGKKLWLCDNCKKEADDKQRK